MIEILGKVMGNASTDSFQFVSNRFFDAKYIIVPTTHFEKNYRIVGDIIKVLAVNPYIEKPVDVRYIGENDHNVRSKTLYVADVTILGVLYDQKIVDFSMPPIPGSDVFKADDLDIKISLGLLEEGLNIGIIKHHGVNLNINMRQFIRTHNSIVGQTGSGKSYLAAKIAIELIKQQKKPRLNQKRTIPIVFDTSGEYSGNDYIHAHHGNICEILKVLPLKDQSFPLLNRRYLGLLYEIYDIDSRLEGILNRWLRGEEKVSSKAIEMNTIPGLFNDEIDKSVKQFSQLKIGSTETLADKLEEFIFNYNELRPKIPISIPSKVFTKMRRFNLKIKKSDDLVISEQFDNGLIVDMSIQNDLIDRQILMKLFLYQLLSSAKAGKLKSRIVLFIDEAHNYVPSIFKSFCKDEIITIAREGRKFGLTLCLISQRPRWVDPTALSQCGNIFIFRIQNSEDQRHIFDSVSLPDSVRNSNISKLRRGEMIIAGDVMETPVRCLVSEIDKAFILKETNRFRKEAMDKFRDELKKSS